MGANLIIYLLNIVIFDWKYIFSENNFAIIILFSNFAQ